MLSTIKYAHILVNYVQKIFIFIAFVCSKEDQNHKIYNNSSFHTGVFLLVLFRYTLDTILVKELFISPWQTCLL
ncbi:unnamed protein product [Rhizophagus irregularis]|nr:unnamed protein product [Rhizophagus irregularis]